MAKKTQSESRKIILRNVKITSKGIEADQMTPFVFILSLLFITAIRLSFFVFIFWIATAIAGKGLPFADLVKTLYKFLPFI